MRKLVVTDPARADLRNIRAYSKKNFGEKATQAYSNLLKQAFREIRDDPDLPGSKHRPEIDGNLRSYHTSLCKERSAPRVNRPRHFILYFEAQGEAVVISRILHDAQDILRQVPDAHALQSKNVPKKNKPDS